MYYNACILYIHIHAYTYIYLYIYLYVYIYTYMCLCVYVYVCICVYMYIYIYIYTHYFIYIYIHTHMWKWLKGILDSCFASLYTILRRKCKVKFAVSQKVLLTTCLDYRWRLSPPHVNKLVLTTVQ